MTEQSFEMLRTVFAAFKELLDQYEFETPGVQNCDGAFEQLVPELETILGKKLEYERKKFWLFTRYYEEDFY